MITVINEKSPYFKKKGKLIQEIKEENKCLIFFKKEELLCEFSVEELEFNQKKEKQAIPRSRQDFYQLINKKETSRTQILNTIKALEERNLFIIKEKSFKEDEKGLSKEKFYDLILNAQYSRNDLISKMREYRDQELIQFLLPNNSYNPKDNLENIQPKGKKKKINKKRSKKKNINKNIA